MLKRRAAIGIEIAAVVLAVLLTWSRGQRAPEREVEREVAVEREAGVQRAVEVEGERAVEVAPEVEVEPEDESTRTERRLAALRQDVRLLDMQRLDAHERSDRVTEARLDREIAAARAEHDRARGIGTPEGI